MIRFLLNDELVSVERENADTTVLNYLREQRDMQGTKEGCAAGDCGACTVVLAETQPDQSGLHYRSVNSCVTFLSALDGKQLITVEHLNQGKTLHPVQQSMVDHHGSQCGFCTPGFIMSMFALYQQDTQVDRDKVLSSLSGNLCRCTGYRPIIDASLAVCGNKADDQFTANATTTEATLKSLTNNDIAGTDSLFIPKNSAQLAQLVKAHPDARLVAGSTDLALESTQQLKPLTKMISLSNVAELKRIDVDDTNVTIGAACPISDIQSVLLEHFPALAELVERFASLPIRNQATLGGNVANASPIGDMPPVLLALGASVILSDGNNHRTVPLNTFFTGYRQTLLQTGEWIDAIVIPRLAANETVKAYKISKRHEDDISAVCAVFKIAIDDANISALSSGFGGVAATPVECQALSEALTGMKWHSADVMATGKQVLDSAFEPIDDVRASAAYRKQVLGNLWHRFWLETNADHQSIKTRVINHA